MSHPPPPAGPLGPRIAYITTAFPWRSETAVIKEMFELDRLGFDIRVISLKRTSFDGVFDPKAFRFRGRSIYPGPRFWLRSFGGVLRHLAHPEFRQLLWLTLRRSGRHLVKTLYILFLVPELARRLQEDGVSYIHANFASFQAFAAMAVHRLTGIPYGFTVHAHDIFLCPFMIPEKVSAAALVVSISRYNAEYMARRFHVPTDGIRIIHCGVDLEEFRPGPEPAESVPLILSVGRLETMKGFDILLEACRRLRGRVAFRCVIVGDGPKLGSLQRQLARDRLRDLIEIRTSAPQEELVGLYRRCQLYVQPCRRTSNGEQDGIPATLMEAMAVGKPTVSTRLSGIPELIQDGREGLLVPSEDPEALAEKMRDLLCDPDRARRMGQEARRKVSREFNIADNTRLLADRIREVLEPRDPRGRGSAP